MRIVRKWKRRRPGIYLARTRKHYRPMSRENGYVGRSSNVPLRRKQHLTKPWADLDPRWYVLRLPWWLGWVWVLAPLEAAAVVMFAPRYNDKLNHWNPRRVKISVQRAQRRARDLAGPVIRTQRLLATWTYRVAGLALIGGGIVGWMATR